MIGRYIVQATVPLTFLLAVWILSQLGTDEIGTREALRGTARLAFVPFVLAFIARPLHDLRPNQATSWLLANQKTAGVCFGLCMTTHLGLILWLHYLSAPAIPEAVTVADFVIGGPGLFMVFVMLVTSADRVRAAMDADLWRRLHTFGIYLVWFIFLACLVDSSGWKPYPAFHYLPFIAILVGAMAIRLGAVFKK
ncbi:MAG: ferric reductase-like transmembrane domain-containing protein [Deltaproteobacteria bacterium]|nr:ferric reductase-like transmembrane domain-containing protein [Deltaproteobacteria bacterium]